MNPIMVDGTGKHMNKDKAMQMLKAKLYLLKQEENAAKEAGIRGVCAVPVELL